ncbi:hypothetical protein TCAL_03597 [Tigriopus californicus]|uniref:XPG-I domain-containing protein n=1 Tax=Tigriopus californicus TaxID=6832 RepID=A0A553NFF2_TIGCA|nr:flap endonuclease GEN-like [Tigriopus californicus]TRY64160.1 hypothetical protein TCAL_03597 [Tigriopus californicus]|eukprot:TCALIF_03597-PA protein Name:"Similar to Gen1 Flap endonuclease GEN homolog 1 (Mus musculus)" AED:0.14 eAED:0.17 QI:0/-1/0/1/-1/1/1/0/609
MGIKTLWPIVECSGETVDLRQLSGQVLAVDLAGWVVQNNQCRAMSHGKVAKPHLRNVFFRTATLLSLGIRPVFILDGHAPVLKRETMTQRKAAQMGMSTQEVEVKSLNRNRLKAVMNECKFLLSALGVQCLAAQGEGEALCAQLNQVGLVDGVISDDSDAFCYGAKIVLRNFSISAKSFSVERFTAKKLVNDLRLSRDRLLFMAILLGCDFCPAGVSGVGKESVLKMFRAWPVSMDAIRVLQYWIGIEFQTWTTCSSPKYCQNGPEDLHCDACEKWQNSVSDEDCLCQRLKQDPSLVKVENGLKKKCLLLPMDWWRDEMPKVLAEFDVKETVPTDLSEFTTYSCPKIKQCLSIMCKKLLWVEEYAMEKLIPLLTKWQIEHLSVGGRQEVIEPEVFVKKRIVSGVSCVVIRWRLINAQAEDMEGLPETFESCDAAELFSQVYPEFYLNYVQTTKPTKKTTVVRKPRALTVKKTNKENEPVTCEEQAQKPITQFFSQQKPVHVVETRPIEALESHNETEVFDCSDLSFIIDDIINKGAMKRQVVETSPLKSNGLHSPLKTSTPTSHRPLKKELRLVQRATTNLRMRSIPHSPVVEDQDPFDIEDSFDRMCK